MAEKTNGTTGSAKSAAGKISKTEAVRQALAKFGKTAMPVKIQGFIKQLGLDMTLSHISNCKSEILRKARGKSPSTAAKPAAATHSAPKAPTAQPAAKAAQANTKTVGSISLKDIQVLKELLGRNTSDSLKSLVDLLSK